MRRLEEEEEKRNRFAQWHATSSVQLMGFLEIRAFPLGRNLDGIAEQLSSKLAGSRNTFSGNVEAASSLGIAVWGIATESLA
jgi:hypothetical protein